MDSVFAVSILILAIHSADLILATVFSFLYSYLNIFLFHKQNFPLGVHSKKHEVDSGLKLVYFLRPQPQDQKEKKSFWRVL